MKESPLMPNGRCPACKIIINGGFTATAANLLAELSASAAVPKLALVASAAHELYERAIKVGVLSINHDEQPDWHGCDRASKILSWIGQEVDEVEINAMIVEIVAEMETVTSGSAREHKHEHDDLL